MKALNIISFIVIVGICSGCYEDKPKEATKLNTHSRNEITLTASKIPDLSSDYLVSVYENQELIKISQDDRDLRKKYCDHSYFKKENLFISMGIGSLINPETGEAIPHHLAERAATLDARRWAGYGELWLNNDYEPNFGKLNAKIKGTITVIDQTVVGDSVFVFVATSLPE
jgi:hypothetical protein